MGAVGAPAESRGEEVGAGNETRTRDPDLGKVVLYQLSYSRATELRILLSGLGVSSDSEVSSRMALGPMIGHAARR